ncbi:MAG: PIN domain-containing protein [Armatimonadota bacterium]
MAQRRLRVALDANVLIAGIRLPRWPHEVMRAALRGYFDLVLPEQVIAEARRHLEAPAQAEVLEFFLASSGYQELPMPPADLVRQQSDLVRSDKDVPIALTLLASDVDIFVTNDRDFTDRDATAQRFRDRVRVMLPAVFLREVLGWRAEDLEAIRNRTWQDIPVEEPSEESDG